MPNSATETAAAPHAVAVPDSPVNVIVRLLKHIAERLDDVGERVSLACGVASVELEVLESFDLGDDLNDRRKALGDDLLEIEIALHGLNEVVDLINELTS
ncbi:hypothetical protein IQ16_02934 [Bradyrhizobium huanghuaihaiense]|uniref:Uncharacterized protein n=1 Tax=Bradyrhizobium huanghuaihaiense TaxID=990078 RepID=A0A562RQE3_9BRAD|nr:hypothetical protein [Bradyrhizobium huanghuaihaiense]TWI71315.1 hypothetical protein IQ16_02934 [Bradyrhizobium huanghuaihaiense]